MKTRYSPFKRFQQVGDNLYRGGQPDAQGFAFLRDLGIKTIVNLRRDDSERPLVESLGMKFIHIPMVLRFLGGRLSEDAVKTFVAAVDDPGNGPIFVHCKRGADRTGAFVALYRMMRDGWNVDRAYGEARDTGMRWWFPKLKGELRRFGGALAAPAAGR